MLNGDDIVKYQQLRSILKEGNFDIKGSAVIPVALLFKWYEELMPRLHEAVKLCEEKQESKKQHKPELKVKTKKKRVK